MINIDCLRQLPNITPMHTDRREIIGSSSIFSASGDWERWPLRQMDNDDEILRTQGYIELWVCRTGKVCSLVIVADGESHVYSDPQGNTKKFRHAWQVKEWLYQRYGIKIDRLEVKAFR